MAIRKIRTDEDPILRKISREVSAVDDRIRAILEDMVETMNYAEGVGLAAPQIGILRRMIVVMTEDNEIIKMVNPQIICSEGEQKGPEACLSVPNYSGDVTRPDTLEVKYLDEKGNEVQLTAKDFLARVICHEVDHLDGILFVDVAEKLYKATETEER